MKKGRAFKVSNRRTEESVRRAFGNAAPNNLKEVMGKCEEQKGRVIILENTAKKKSGRVFSRVMAAAAALVLIVTGTYLYGANHSVASTVALDVNPSIELGVNKKEQVVLVTPKNEDGVKVIGDMKLKGSDLKVAVNAIIGSMLREGYISELANSILISVDSDDPIKSAEMQSRLSAEVKDMLDTNPYLQKVVVAGASEALIRAVPDIYRDRVRFYGEKALKQEETWKRFASEHVNEPVYISIDKDVLNPESAVTNWDQGSLSLQELEQLLAVVFRHEKIAGIDICGECSATLDLFEEKREAAINGRANQELLELISSFRTPTEL